MKICNKKDITNRNRLYNFSYLIKHIRKGVYRSLQMVHVKDKSKKIIKVLTNHYDIEKAIIDCNKVYYQKEKLTIQILVEIRFIKG